MSLKPGTTFGPYEILGALGAGGMGEVYRARDTKLAREVAIKVLPGGFARDPERRARFEREARLLATLNHPHIGAIYGLEDAHDAPVLVLELVEGPTLAERLRTGALPIDEALAVARQVIDALDAAHEKGVVHRDLKPSNIKVRSDGTVKVLDFGLAKALDAGDKDLSQSPTITSAGTGEGVMLGTAAYMSPEQARAHAVDRRADIWAFGCVLYELLSGRRAFPGATISDTLVSILEREPDWRAVPDAAPAAIRRLLRRCLEKDPRRRLRDIADARIELEEASAADRAGLQATRRHPMWIGAVAAAMAAVIAVAAVILRPRPALRPPVRLSVVAPTGTTFVRRDMTEHPQFALSPDGSRLAFVAARRNGASELWIRSLASATAQPVPGSEGATGPFWAPDSQQLAFFARGKLKRLSLGAAVVQDVADATFDVASGTWNRDGTIIFAGPAGDGLFRVSDHGGPATAATRLDSSRGDTGHQWPQFLPDGRRFLFYVRSTTPEHTGVYLGSLDADSRKLVLRSEASAVYAEPGHLLFEQNGNLMAQEFDATTGALAGDPFALGDRIVGLLGPCYLPLSVARDGTLAYWNAQLTPTELLWFDRSGRPAGKIDMPTRTDNPTLSPDAASVLVTARPNPNESDLWRIDVSSGLASRLTFSGRARFPIWSCDGQSVVFSTMDRLLQKSASGAGDDAVVLGPRYRAVFPDDCSRDGRWLIYGIPGTGWDVWAMDRTDRQSRSILNGSGNQVQPRLSPDGRWLAYASDESGAWEVYVQPFPDGRGKWQVSTAGGSQPLWRADGKELFYVTAIGRLAAVPVRSSALFETGPTQPLFETRVPPMLAPYRTSYAVSPDGQRFLLNSLRSDADPTAITVLLNWQAGLTGQGRTGG